MKRLLTLGVLGMMAWGSAAVLSGCKSAPVLTRENALSMIQAQYDHQAPVSAAILVNDDGMKTGVTAKYWDLKKPYPNHYWADFKLTDSGKKALKLPGGGETIEWRPDNPTDTKYQIVVNPVTANHLKAENASEPQDDMGTKTVHYDEVTSLEGVPDPLQQMARDSSTRVSVRRTATFVLDNGAWKLQSIN